jgi:tetratricopeptide (TPR) repeat protein
MWVRWHIPDREGGKALQAFEARDYADAAVTAVSGNGGRQPAAGGSGDTDLSPLEEQARALADSDPSTARDLWRQAAEEEPENVRAHFSIGLLHLDLEEYPEAIAAFERVLALAPEMVDARFNLGFAYAKIHRYEDAIRQYASVIEMAPAYLDEVLFNLAIVQDFQGDRQAAARSLQDAIRYNPHNVRAISYLARMEGRFSTPP